MRALLLVAVFLVPATVSVAAEPPRSAVLEPGAVVRLTGAASIHLPGLVDMDGQSVQVHGARALANEGGRILIEGPGGERIAVPYPGRHLEARLVSLEPDAYVVALGSAAERVSVPRPAIERVEVRVANASRARHAVGGLLLGAAVGAVVGLISASTCHPNEWFCSPGFNAAGFAVLGAPVGLLGGLAMPVERWQRVGEPQLRLSVGPTPGSGVGIQLHLCF
jgi:uncharacterized protein YcfJ